MSGICLYVCQKKNLHVHENISLPKVFHFTFFFHFLSRPVSLFSVVRFKNTACTGSSGDSGTCYAKHSCLLNGGSLEGTCAGGFGSCCVSKYLRRLSARRGGKVRRKERKRVRTEGEGRVGREEKLRGRETNIKIKKRRER